MASFFFDFLHAFLAVSNRRLRGYRLRDMKERAVLPEGSITRVAVIGPGLDFADKGYGYDFYPVQTLQPFAIYDSLIR